MGARGRCVCFFGGARARFWRPRCSPHHELTLMQKRNLSPSDIFLTFSSSALMYSTKVGMIVVRCDAARVGVESRRPHYRARSAWGAATNRSECVCKRAVRREEEEARKEAGCKNSGVFFCGKLRPRPLRLLTRAIAPCRAPHYVRTLSFSPKLCSPAACHSARARFSRKRLISRRVCDRKDDTAAGARRSDRATRAYSLTS